MNNNVHHSEGATQLIVSSDPSTKHGMRSGPETTKVYLSDKDEKARLINASSGMSDGRSNS